MKNNEIDKNTLFSEKELKLIPLTYRTMKTHKTEFVGELNVNISFSKSSKHYSEQYIVYTSHKPISNFILLINDN